jgi:hypothetical protein
MFNPYDANQPDEPLLYTKTRHISNAKCQCRLCAKIYTITMLDRDFLKSIGIVWRLKTKQDKLSADSTSFIDSQTGISKKHSEEQPK